MRGKSSDQLPRDVREMTALAFALGYPAGESDELTNDYRDMIYAETAADVEARDRDVAARKAELDAEQAEIEWHDLDEWVKWLKSTFGLPPNIVPPYWHRHDELVWELSALHCHWLSCYHESASPSARRPWPRLWCRR